MPRSGSLCSAQAARHRDPLLAVPGSWQGKGRVHLTLSPPQFLVYLSKLMEGVVPTRGDALQGIWLLILEMLSSHLGHMVTC